MSADPLPPRLSVVTATRGRRALLLRKADTLLAQTLDPDAFEWLVCVDGDDDGSHAALSRLETPFRLTVVPFATPRGAAAARNACADRARGEVLYLSDDDCLLPPDALERHRAAQRSPVVVIGGIDFVTDAHAGGEVAPGAVERFTPRRGRYWNLNGANTSLPLAAFREAGGFDESLRGYGGEDLLLGYRLARLGVPFRARPDIRVRHLGPNPMRGADPVKALNAGRNAARIARRHPELALRLGVHPVSFALKRLLFPVYRRFAPGRYAYERAYDRGAHLERRADRPHQQRS